MKSVMLKRLTLGAAALAVVFGCDSVINHIIDEASQGDGTTTTTGADDTSTFTGVDSEFSDAPSSPGGTGGTVADDGEPIGEETRSFFTAYQIDPESEDTAGPKFVVSGDVDQDGLLDLVSGWNQSQPVQLHLQRRDAEDNVSFRTVTLGGTTPIAIIAGVELGQINDDGWLDIVVLSKATGYTGWCPPDNPGDPPKEISALDGEIIVLFSPGNAGLVPDGDSWTEMILVNPFVQDPWIHDQYPGDEAVDFEELKTKPEWGGFTALAVANVDGVAGDDIIVALNPGECKNLGQKPPTNTVDLWTNPGPGLFEISSQWGAPPPGVQSRNVPITLMGDAPQVKDIAVMDVDGDGDPDVVATYTDSISQNVRWARNPLVPHTVGGPSGPAEVIAATPDGFDLCDGGVNDDGPCPSGDSDCFGTPDGTCVASVCNGGLDDGDACENNGDCLGVADGTCVSAIPRHLATGWELRPIGQLDTGADVLDVGDIDGDGFEDILLRSTAGQIVQWFRRPNELTVQPEFPPNDPAPDRFNFPWPVFTLTELEDQEPEGIAIGDVTGDGRPEVMIAAEGAVFWYDRSTAPTVFDPWSPNTIIQDNPADTTDATAAGATGTPAAPGTGVGVTEVDTSTHINSLLVVDLDGDGRNDIVGTLDRRAGAGLSDDRLVWYRNTRTETTTPDGE